MEKLKYTRTISPAPNNGISVRLVEDQAIRRGARVEITHSADGKKITMEVKE